jgi:aminoglycoside phosphotransferase (APT) family kinase protein
VNVAALPFTRSSADAALAEAGSALGVATASAELIRMGSAAVYWLQDRSVVARVSRSIDQLDTAQREIAVSRWLAASGVAAVRALDVPQPAIAGHRVVTFWESVADREEYGTTAELAQLLRDLHALTVPGELRLPTVHPIDKMRDRLRRTQALTPTDRDFLVDRCATLMSAYGELNFVLPAGVIHGDANVGNVLRARDGRAVLADLDGFAIGPREWDLLQTAIFYDRFSWHTEAEYRSFIEIYGYDIMQWDGYEVLADIRELSMVTWLSQNAATDGKAAVELAKRIDSLRTNGSRKDWLPL